MDYYDLECASQEDIHNEIKNKLMELNELVDYSETYHSCVFDEELLRIGLVDNLNNILIENKVPERFKVLSGDVDAGKFLGVRALLYLDDGRLSDKEWKLVKNITKKALPYLKFIDEVLDNIAVGKKLVISDMFTEYNHSSNDIDHIKFNLTNDGRGIVDIEITLKKTTTDKFKILYFKTAHHFSGNLDVMDYEDSFIPGPNIPGGKHIGVDENPITVKDSVEVSDMIAEGIDCLYGFFDDLSKKYKNMCK